MPRAVPVSGASFAPKTGRRKSRRRCASGAMLCASGSASVPSSALAVIFDGSSSAQRYGYSHVSASESAALSPGSAGLISGGAVSDALSPEAGMMRILIGLSGRSAASAIQRESEALFSRSCGAMGAVRSSRSASSVFSGVFHVAVMMSRSLGRVMAT